MLKNAFLLNFGLLSILFLSFHKITSVHENVHLSEEAFFLSIPSLHLEQEFFPFDEQRNTVAYGIQTIFPNPKTSMYENFLLASHSGNGDRSYFNQLEQLEQNDEVILKHQGLEKLYRVVKKDYKDKDGVLSIQESYSHFVLLITCSHIYPDKQVYYLAVANH